MKLQRSYQNAEHNWDDGILHEQLQKVDEENPFVENPKVFLELTTIPQNTISVKSKTKNPPCERVPCLTPLPEEIPLSWDSVRRA